MKISSRHLKKLLWITSAAFVIVVTSIFILKKFREKPRHKVAVHFIARYSVMKGDSAVNTSARNFAKLHEVCLKHYLAQLDQDFPNFHFELVIHDNKSDSATSYQTYKEISEEKGKGPLIVIDNTWGKHLKGCADLIRVHNIPVIALNPDHTNQQFGRSSIFIGNDDKSPSFVVNFLTKILKKDTVNYISELDYHLDSVYFKLLRDVRVNPRISFKSSVYDTSEWLKSLPLINALNLKYPTIINLHSVWGKKIFEYINNRNDTAKDAKQVSLFLWPIYALSSLTTEEVKTDDVHYIFTMDRDAISKSVAADLKYFTEKYDDEGYFKRFSAQTFIRRCQIATDIIRNHVSSYDLTIDSISNKKWYQDFSETNHKFIHPFEEMYEFNDGCGCFELVHMRSVSEWKKNETLHTFSEQLNSHDIKIPNIMVGIEPQDILEIDFTHNQYTLDFSYYIKLKKSYLKKFADTVVFSNLVDLELNPILPSPVIQDSFAYFYYKAHATFRNFFDVSNFPFDHYELPISMQVKGGNNVARISFDPELSATNFDIRNTTVLNGWSHDSTIFTINNEPVSIGNSFNMSNLYQNYDTVSCQINVTRKPFGPFISMILPLLLLGIMAITMFFLKDKNYSNIGLASGALLLSTLAFSISVSPLIPVSHAISKLIWLYLWTLAFVFLNCMIPILHDAGLFHVDHKPQYSRHLGIFFLSFYILIFIIIIIY